MPPSPPYKTLTLLQHSFTQLREASSPHLEVLGIYIFPAMAAKFCATTALLLALNLLFFMLVSGTYVPCPPQPVKPPPIKPPPVKPPSCGGCPPVYPSCPRDTLKLATCSNLLNLLKLKLGNPPNEPCCSLLEGLADLEAAVCLCTVIKASVLGINLNIPVDLTLLLNYCGKEVPYGFKCA